MTRLLQVLVIHWLAGVHWSGPRYSVLKMVANGSDRLQIERPLYIVENPIQTLLKCRDGHLYVLTDCRVIYRTNLFSAVG
jgi:hypothetical protein